MAYFDKIISALISAFITPNTNRTTTNCDTTRVLARATKKELQQSPNEIQTMFLPVDLVCFCHRAHLPNAVVALFSVPVDRLRWKIDPFVNATHAGHCFLRSLLFTAGNIALSLDRTETINCVNQ